MKRLQRRSESAVLGFSARHFSGEFGECFAVSTADAPNGAMVLAVPDGRRTHLTTSK